MFPTDLTCSKKQEYMWKNIRHIKITNPYLSRANGQHFDFDETCDVITHQWRRGQQIYFPSKICQGISNAVWIFEIPNISSEDRRWNIPQ